jgi:hypothetical protein
MEGISNPFLIVLMVSVSTIISLVLWLRLSKGNRASED